ncbi:IclR family transcriptional regulator C-terminal domain-containing protein [Variovorax sp. J22R24]|uniref:IclR family transcriptional regulator domain-containing protein n=1 Tax=Variovorax gracilis TaxID=3053502 RepID=UPI002577EF15|nr:IclR family transcriptional regulator C-terminal domain-containing protein [Variovorax sp. J22R24]MDM0107713.1 IclR family transcriptional regulator C-terminal domain-containing protein [Variovorax sp. J22R24]
MATSPGEGTGALEKALDVLDAIGSSPQGLGQSELAERLSLPRTTVYRLLATLVARGLIRRDPLRKVYCLGFRCFEMARQAYAMPDLVAAAALELRALRDLTGETSYLATLDGREVISLERCDGAHSQRSAAALGQRKPVHCTSQGKAILSAMPDDARDAIVRDAVLKPLTPLTITDRRRLQAELRITKARGYAIDDEEIVLGVRCVGAPVVDSAGQVRGAISVAGPAYRLTRSRLELLGPEVAEAARRVGAQLPPVGADATASTEAAVTALPGSWAFHGAYPIWSADGERLWWADALAPSVHLFELGQDREVTTLDGPVVGLLRSGGDVVVVTERAAFRVDAQGSKRPLTPWLSGQVLAVCNGDDETVWAAIALPEAGAAVGQVRGDGTLDVQWRVGETVQSLGWSATSDALYATAPVSGAILLLQPGQGVVRRLASVPKGSGRVSGLAFDAQGGIWTALCDGWSVVRFTPDGQLDRVVGLPVPCATDLAFSPAPDDTGGEKLVITTARHSVPLDTLPSAPLSGRLVTLTT